MCKCTHKCTTGTHTHTAPYCHLHLSPGHPPARSHRGLRGKQGLSQSLFPPHPLTFLCISVHSILMCLPRSIHGLYHPALTKLILQGSQVTYKIPAKKLQPILLSQREVELRLRSSAQVRNHKSQRWEEDRTTDTPRAADTLSGQRSLLPNPGRPKFNPQDPHGGRREPTP